MNDQPPETTQRRVRSFDMFDTLVARRCITPERVFALLEQRSGLQNFAAARIAAERALTGTVHGLADIYANLCKRHDLPTDTGDALMRMEIALEREMLFPVAEICALFRAGDIVVSDMYMPADFLTSILRETCFLQPARLYLSTNGKRSGAAWPEIAKDYIILEHYGDNPQSDIASAQQAGIPTRHVTLTAVSPMETALDRAGFGPLAELAREARLRGHHPSPALRNAQMLQTQLNFPLLFLSTLALLREANARGWKKILFSGRDCYLWNSLYQQLYPIMDDAPQAEYFYTSRIARMRPSADYLAYFEAMRAGEPVAIVDLAGTGWSLLRLIEHAKPGKTDIFLIHQLERESLKETYQTYAPTRGGIEPIAIIRREAVSDENEVLEELNRAPHAMVTDMRATKNGFRPELAAETLPGAGHVLLATHHESFFAACRLLRHLDHAKLRAMSQQPVAEIIAEIYMKFQGHSQAFGVFRPGKTVEENLFLAALKRLPARA